MKNFELHPICPKCGTTEAEAHWHAKDSVEMYGSMLDAKFYEEECFVRRCKFCGFTWQERTLDNAQPTTENL